ncbi:MarR family transcriptional regulator [Bifidobacterium lemurum]|uniref:MarR family transcriptional regulator n=1 Tax=Bifidobacterium lemurum TaxID=1603886 RepID=A0A261FUH8_9BIFI|nr:transcriptional regulator [Bifidobacterium lemurum]OZG62841.1 MarR family transcriptional regulator [Bifidobacterium lemurum]QOL35171.1 transcriptional regulator [Bifidobacterium lemurum]
MSWELDAVTELMGKIKRLRSSATDRLGRAVKGEPAVLHELLVNGTMTPSQLAVASHNSSGRISTLLSTLEKKGYITREIDPKDRRNILVNLTDAGRGKGEEYVEEMRAMMCWVFQQMGERRTREFVDLIVEFMTYSSLCVPGEPRPTRAQIDAAFAADAGRKD